MLTQPNQRKNLTLPNKRFVKNDEGFICVNCGKIVLPLGRTSRDHCTNCLHSVHVDINPGDRANPCKGILVPVGIEHNTKKGIIINYICNTCGEKHNCKAAPDDNYDAIIRVSSYHI